MDKKFGAPWHVVVGSAFSYEITTEVCMCVDKSGSYNKIVIVPFDTLNP